MSKPSALIDPTKPALPLKRTMTVDIGQIRQRVAIAEGHPDPGNVAMAKDLLVQDAKVMLMLLDRLGPENAQLKEMVQKATGEAQNAGTILALVLWKLGEIRWTKADVEAYEVTGGWEMADDGDHWLLRATLPEPTLSADEQTEDSPDEAPGA